MKDAYRPTIRTNEPSDQRTFGTMNLRNNEPSDQRTFGTTNLRSKKPSEHREAPGLLDSWVAYSYCTPIYTDGSKDNDRVGCGLIIHNLSIKQRLLLKLKQLT